jgi:protein-S-isoprenylcysteine O-methyltransferase Ste14
VIGVSGAERAGERDMNTIGAVEVIIFGAVSIAALVASIDAWRTKQIYGLFRFLGFECIALLVALNADVWFRNPFAIRQLLSWTIFVVSVALAVHGFHLLRSVGGARRRVVEDTHGVVEVGAYRYIRHPLYASLIFFGWGVFLKGVDIPSAVLASIASVFWYVTARCEERFNVDRFGAAYAEYMEHTKMFVPFVV